jgi:hypothetical protein
LPVEKLDDPQLRDGGVDGRLHRLCVAQLRRRRWLREVLNTVAVKPVALGGFCLLGRFHGERDVSACAQHGGVDGRRARRAPCRFHERHEIAQLELAALGIGLPALFRRLLFEQHRQRRAAHTHAVAEQRLDAAEMPSCTRECFARSAPMSGAAGACAGAAACSAAAGASTGCVNDIDARGAVDGPATNCAKRCRVSVARVGAAVSRCRCTVPAAVERAEIFCGAALDSDGPTRLLQLQRRGKVFSRRTIVLSTLVHRERCALQQVFLLITQIVQLS